MQPTMAVVMRVCLVVCALFVAGSCGGAAASKSVSDAIAKHVPHAEQADKAEQGEKAKNAKRAPVLMLETLDGRHFTVQTLKGKVVVLDFMASWCRPCEKAVPHYIEMQAKHGKDGLQVVFVSQDEDLADLRPFVNDMGITQPIGIDKGEQWYKAYGVKALPTAVLIGRGGRVRATVDGSEDERFTARVDTEVAKLLAESMP
jgi:thiol-disulfide isomerase/thioredoxin